MKQQMASNILTLLSSSSGFFSGVMIARKFNVSRSAVLKMIKELRAAGCVIDSRPGQGYRLASAPDRLDPLFIAMGLKTTVIGRRILYYPEIDSTNTEAKKIAAGGVPDGTLVIADYQLQGQGRLKRQWLSPPKKNLLMSVILYPQVAPSKVFQMTLFSSLAVCKSLKALYNINAGIKWPNDVYVNNRKMCGVLTEVSFDKQRVKWAVVGIGLNVNVDFSNDLELCHIATSVKQETGKAQKRLPLLKKILEEMDLLYKRFLAGEARPIRDEWLSHSVVIGKKVTVFSDGYHETGTAETIDEDGALMLRTSDGKIKKIVAGDVSLRMQKAGDRSQKSGDRRKESE